MIKFKLSVTDLVLTPTISFIYALVLVLKQIAVKNITRLEHPLEVAR